jgi:hypothetical protein
MEKKVLFCYLELKPALIYFKRKYCSEKLKKIKIDPPFDKIVSFGYLQVYLNMNDADNTENALKEGQQFIDKIGNR